MPIPRNVNLDALMYVALGDILEAVHGWVNGLPTDEVALLNRVTEKLARRRRGCDVGLQFPMKVIAQIANLHRRGPNQTDKYGSDLAVTVSVDGDTYLKTAFFQLKRAENYQVTIEKAQLDAALGVTTIGSRSFVVAADNHRSGIRIRDVGTLSQSFPADQAAQSVNASDWQSLTEWLQGWLACDIGPSSDPRDPCSPETLLQSFYRETPEGQEWQTGWVLPKANIDLPDIIPARSWVVLFFKTENELRR